MSKHIKNTQTEIDLLNNVIKACHTPWLKFYDGEDLDVITDNWLQLDCFNLSEDKPTLPDDDLENLWATIFGSKRSRKQIESFYVRINSDQELILFSFQTLESAVDFVKRIRQVYSEALKESKSPYKKTVLN